ncbi:MAG: hypothetical protein QF682_11735, partial [Candidatus Thermoplasmatota archaeon]|nr:hypothetical protein [Candidatus Thermoplasmatota archaeon]
PDLAPETEYHFQIGFSDPDDNSLSYGARGTFSTQNVDERKSDDIAVPVSEDKNTIPMRTILLMSLIIIIIISFITLLIFFNKRNQKNDYDDEDPLGRIRL